MEFFESYFPNCTIRMASIIEMIISPKIKNLVTRYTVAIIGRTQFVVIVSRNVLNDRGSVVVVVPCVRPRENDRQYPSQVDLHQRDTDLPTDLVALTEAVQTVPKSGLGDYYGSLPGPTMDRVDQALIFALDLPGQVRRPSPQRH